MLENMKFLGKLRATRNSARKRANCARPSPWQRGPTPPRVKVARRYRKQLRMGLAQYRKECVHHGLATHPTKVKVVYPAIKVPHPNISARKVGAPFYIVDRP